MTSAKRKRSTTSSSSTSTDGEEKSSEDTDTKPPEDSEAAAINLNLVRVFEAGLQGDIERDLTELIPTDYRKRLAKAKEDAIVRSRPVPSPEATIRERSDTATNSQAGDSDVASAKTPEWYGRDHRTDYVNDHRPGLTPDLPFTVLFPFSEHVEGLLNKQKEKWGYSADTDSPTEIADVIVEVLWDCQVLYCQSPAMVLRCSKEIVVKVKDCDTTEYTSCEYITRNAPDIPVPRMHGCARLGTRLIMFMTYIPSTNLENVWPKLSPENKRSISDQLGSILERLRTIRQPDGLPFGGVAGEAAWEPRANTGSEKFPKPILTSQDFERISLRLTDWDLGKSPYMRLLHSVIPPPAPGSVFTHGELHPVNIMVDKDEEGQYFISGLIDWEFSGFYPEYQEMLGITRYQRFGMDHDWCFYLPEVVSPHRDRLRFVYDQLMDRWVMGW